MTASVEARVKGIICKQLGMNEEEITLDSRLVHDLGVDSLDMIEIIMALEEEYDMEIPDEDAEKFRTVQDLIGYIDFPLGPEAA